MKILISLLGIIALVLLVALYASFTSGLVVYKFWYWFIQPVFPQLPSVSFIQSVGLAFFIGLFKNYTPSIKKEYKEDADQYLPYIYPWITLGLGYILKIIFF